MLLAFGNKSKGGVFINVYLCYKVNSFYLRLCDIHAVKEYDSTPF